MNGLNIRTAYQTAAGQLTRLSELKPPAFISPEPKPNPPSCAGVSSARGGAACGVPACAKVRKTYSFVHSGPAEGREEDVGEFGEELVGT